jgi:hypothetical protein
MVFGLIEGYPPSKRLHPNLIENSSSRLALGPTPLVIYLHSKSRVTQGIWLIKSLFQRISCFNSYMKSLKHKLGALNWIDSIFKH